MGANLACLVYQTITSYLRQCWIRWRPWFGVGSQGVREKHKRLIVNQFYDRRKLKENYHKVVDGEDTHSKWAAHECDENTRQCKGLRGSFFPCLLLTHPSVIYRENEHIMLNNVELFKCGKSWGFAIFLLKIARRFEYCVSVASQCALTLFIQLNLQRVRLHWAAFGKHRKA